jgi:hypothetical protein
LKWLDEFELAAKSGSSGTHSAPAPASAAHAAAVHANNLNNARALESGLLCVMLAPMALKFLLYFGLYWTLPRDRIDESAADKGSDGCLNEEECGGSHRGSSPACGGGSAAVAEGTAVGGEVMLTAHAHMECQMARARAVAH